MLAKQQAQLADPAYRERMRGLALVEAGDGEKGGGALSRGLKGKPKDAGMVGGMGGTQARAGHRDVAVLWLERAVEAGKQSTLIGKWQSLLQTNRYWLAVEQGDKALAQHDVEGAERAYRAAQKIDSTDSYALIGLGDVAMARKDAAGAELFWQHALRLDATNTTTVRRLAGLYQAESPARVMQFISTLPAGQQREMAGTLRALRTVRLPAEAHPPPRLKQLPQPAPAPPT